MSGEWIGLGGGVQGARGGVVVEKLSKLCLSDCERCASRSAGISAKVSSERSGGYV
jgi:hypothetical protein